MLFKIFLLLLLSLIYTTISSSTSTRTSKIGSGRDTKPTENLDYVILNIVFQNQMQKCGGALIAPQFVLTSATCVYDPVEGIATVINATFPQYRPLEFINSKLKVTIHPNYSAETHGDDIAIVKLMTPMPIDGRFLALSTLATDSTEDLYVDTTLRACGMGSITNYPRPPRFLQCTELYGVTAANCSTNSNIICTQWSDRDNNMCNGDYGGPIYWLNETTAGVNQKVVGIAQYSPDYRTASPCLDGHKVSHANVAAYMDWITEVLS